MDIRTTVDRGSADDRRDRPRLVAVDDDAQLLRLLEAVVTDDFQLTTATDGATGLELVRRLRPDGLILDVMMPEMDGFEVLQGIRADPELDGLVVVMLTADSSPVSRQRGAELDVDAWMTKPYDPEMLLATLELLLAHAAFKVQART